MDIIKTVSLLCLFVLLSNAESLRECHQGIMHLQDQIYSYKCLCSLAEKNNVQIDCSNVDLRMCTLRFPNNTVWLSLKNTKLTTLKREYFRNMASLRKLDVSENMISTVEDACFDDLNLEELNIKNLQTATLYPTPIFKLKSLKKIGITYRGSMALSSFADLKQLKHLDFSGSRIGKLDLSLVQNLSASPIKMLNFSNCSLEEITGKIEIEWSSNLTVLDISSNKKFGGRNFARLIANLKGIYTRFTLVANTITSSAEDPILLNGTVVQYLDESRIRNLLIDDNIVRRSKYYNNSRKLDFISLSFPLYSHRNGNQRKPKKLIYSRNTLPKVCRNFWKIQTYSFLSARKIFTATNNPSYSYNELKNMRAADNKDYETKKIHIDMASYTKSLENGRKTCCKDVFKKNRTLIMCFLNECEHVRIEGFNVIFHKKINRWRNFVMLMNLSMENIQELLGIVEICKCIYFPSVNKVELIRLKNASKIFLIRVIGLQQMTYLRIDNSRVQMINTAFLSSFPNLLYLSLAHNELGRMFNDPTNDNITVELFKNLRRLEKLDLSNNGLSRFPQGVFSGQFMLKHLVLKQNRISLVDFDISSLPNLLTLDLSYNSIKTMSPENMAFLSQRENSVMLNFKESQLTCTCEHSIFLQWIKSTNTTMIDKGKVHCRGYASTQSLEQFDPSPCPEILPPIPYATIIITTGLGIIALATIMVIIANFNKLRYRFYLTRYSVVHFQKQSLLKKYGIHISYCTSDSAWVLEFLKPKVKRMGYKPYTKEDQGYGRDSPVEIIILSEKYLKQNPLVPKKAQEKQTMIIQVSPIKNNPLSQNPNLLEWCDKEMTDECEDEFWEKLKSLLDMQFSMLA